MEIKRIAVIGAGVMGRGIAHVGASSGHEVNLFDVKEEMVDDALASIRKELLKGVQLGKVRGDDVDRIMNSIHKKLDMAEACRDADLVIEAVPEDMMLKRKVFAQLDEFAPANAILATNTSTMSPTEIASATRRAEKVIAMHFFNPVHKMKLLEVIKGLETSQETVELALAVGEKMGKKPVLINEYPGFIASRVSALVGNEAFNMLQEGVASARDIDKAITLGLNYPIGPFELGDIVGLDVRLKSLEYMHQTLGEKYRPSPLLVKYIKAGRLGRKTGKGVYDYSE